MFFYFHFKSPKLSASLIARLLIKCIQSQKGYF